MKRNILFMVAIVILASCSPKLTPFTDSLKRSQSWSEEDLKKIQYFISDDVVLWREISDGESKIEGGTIKIKNGKKIEEIVFRKGTPGVLLFTPKGNRFAIGFESTNDKYLMFGPGKKYDEYVLLASDWKRDNGRISYDEKIYFTSEDSADATLMVDLRAVRELEVKSRTAQGRTIK